MEPRDLNYEEQEKIAQEEKYPEMTGKPVKEFIDEWKKTIPEVEPDEIDKAMIEAANEINDGTTKSLEEVKEEIEGSEPPKAIEDTENPVNEVSVKQIGQLLKQVSEMVQIMENQWNTSKREFKLTDTHMKQLYQYNEEHRTEMPEGLSDEEQQNWDRFNGLDNIPEEKVLEIFGEGHPIIGVANSQTIDRIKDCVNDFFSWMASMKEYRQIHDAYLELIEIEEQKNIEQLQEIADNETDPERKAKLEESIKLYYNRKYLEFMADPMDEKDRDRLVKAFNDERKIQYWLQRTRDKLKQIKVAEKFILEISQFEKRYLPEKYHKCSNMILLYFMQTIVYSDMYDKNGSGRNKVVCMVFALDGIVRKTWKDEIADRVMTNLMAMLDQVIDMIPDPEPVQKQVLSSAYGEIGEAPIDADEESSEEVTK